MTFLKLYAKVLLVTWLFGVIGAFLFCLALDRELITGFLPTVEALLLIPLTFGLPYLIGGTLGVAYLLHTNKLK